MGGFSNENDGFVSAADFFRQQAQPPPPLGKAAAEPRRPVRESLLVVARNSQVKNKISAFDKHASTGGPAGFGSRPAAAPHRPGAAAGSGSSLGSSKPLLPPRRAVGAPALGAIAEEPAGLAAAPPLRRHAAVVSTVAAAPVPRRHAAVVDTAAPSVVLPSPATKQEVAEKRHEARFPSIMFHPPQPAGPARAPLPGSVAVLPPAPQPQPPAEAALSRQPRPLPSVLATVRASLSPQKQPAMQAAAPAVPTAAALEAAAAQEAAAAAAASMQPEEEYFVDAESGTSGAPSVENSGVWADAKDHHLVIQEDDAASVASDASTVVHDHSDQWEQAEAEMAALLDAPLSAGLPAPVPRDSLLLAPEEQPAPAPSFPALSTYEPSADGKLFQAASTQLPPLDGVPAGRASLSPAASAGCRRLSIVSVAELQAEAEVSQRASFGGSMAESVVAAEQAAAAAAATQPEQQFSEPAAEAGASALPASTFSGALELSGDKAGSGELSVGENSSASGPSLPEASGRLSLASSTATLAPSLAIEYSEASLRYSVDHMPHSPRAHLSQELSQAEAAAELPAAAAATPQQRRLSAFNIGSPAAPANTPASPGVLGPASCTVHRAAAEQHSLPVPAAAVAQAIQTVSTCCVPAAGGAAVVESAAGAPDTAPSRRASLIPLPPPAAAEEAVHAQAEVAGAAGDAAQAPAAPASLAAVAARLAPAAAASPVPPTPYAATEYDGDDVVMMDIDSPRLATARRAPAGSSRFQQEAAATVGREPAPAPMPAPVSEPEPQLPSASEVAAQQPAPVAGAVEQEEAALAAAAEEAQAAEAAVPETAMPAMASPPPAAGAPAPSPAAAAPAAAEELHANAVAGAAPVATGGPAALEAAQPADLPQERSNSGSGGRQSLPGLPLPEAAARRGRTGRLSLPSTGRYAALGAETSSRSTRLSLPAGISLVAPPTAVEADAAAFAAQPKLAMSPVAAAPAVAIPTAPSPLSASEQAAEPMAAPQDQEDQQQQSPPPQQQQQHQEVEADPQQDVTAEQAVAPDAGSPVAAEEAPVAFVGRSRLAADDAEVPLELPAGPAEAAPAPEPAADEQPEAAAVPVASSDSGAAAGQAEPPTAATEAAVVEAAADDQQHAIGLKLQQEDQQQELDEKALAAQAFAAKPKLAMSPVLSTGAASRRSSYGAVLDPDDAAAFAARPKLAQSPVGSSGSAGTHSASAAATAAAASTADSQPAEERQASPAGALPTATASPEQAQEAVQNEQHEQGPAGQAARHDSPTMSNNPLAAAGITPHVSSGRRLSHSPAPSGASAGAVSNNPLYAGTPAHPTPPSVTLKSFPGRASFGGTPNTGGSGSSTPASAGIKLAGMLQHVAEQLQNPAAPQGLAALATPGGAKLAIVAKTPGTRFEFAEDVAAMMQALDARTPATAMGQQPALGRASVAVATTVQRPMGTRLPRYSFAAGGSTLIDLDNFDANGDRNAAAGPTPLLRQQLLGTTPVGWAAVNGAAGATAAGAVSPTEVNALREEVSALRKQVAELNSQRDDMVGLLGGYQSSIAELQDKHSVLVVQLQGENTALKAEVEQLRASHDVVDGQFRALYHDKYVPLKAEAAGLRQEAAALQKRVVAEELKAHKAASDLVAAQQEVAAAHERVQRYKAALLEQQTEAAAARDSVERLQQELAGVQKHADKALAAKEAELADVKCKYNGLTKQYDEAVHRINLAKQARERAQLEVQRKEEEVVALEVRLKEYENALKEYKKENGKFFEMKERYKSAIAGLERDLKSMEKEKLEALSICNDLMTRLERAGLN